jgi:hypothetical protein
MRRWDVNNHCVTIAKKIRQRFAPEAANFLEVSVPLEKFNLMQMLTRLVSETFRNTSYTFSGQKNRFRNVCLLTFHRRRMDEMINNTVPLGKNVLCRPRCDRLKNVYFRKLF